MRRHCFPVYWNGENRRVLRGHWFARKGGLDWIPLREDVSEQLELAYNCQVSARYCQLLVTTTILYVATFLYLRQGFI
jgi:hypothetical protein